MTSEDVRIIFGNVEELAVFSDRFVMQLERAIGAAADSGSCDDRVGALFLDTVRGPLSLSLLC